MKPCICFIILGITQFQSVFTTYINNTENYESYASCPFTYLRRKRAQSDYTRWRANLESSSEEFLVKILDEDLTTSNTKQIVAVNISPESKRQEKIIVDGAIVPPATAKKQEKDLLKEYTRFVSPHTNDVAEINEGIFLAPVPRIKITTNVPEPRIQRPESRVQYGIWPHSKRDDSPPASPQFLPRTPILLDRQYAPVTPVTFTKLKQSSQEISIPTKTTMKPIRTSIRDWMFLPTRTKSDSKIEKVISSDEEESYTPKQIPLTRSTFIPQQVPLRSSVAVNVNEFYELPDVDKKVDDDKKKVSDKKESESLYNSMFYNDEDNETGGQRTELVSRDDYDEKNENGDNSISGTKSTLVASQYFISPEQFRDGVETPTTHIDHTYLDDYDMENDTTIIQKDVTMLESNVTTLPKEKLKHKRNPICNLLKLRQLTFNSPRTLPEIVVQLKQWAEDSPVAKWIDITGGNYTAMENPIYLIIVDDPSSGQIVSAKQTVMIVAGIQGRDHHAVSAAMYVLYQLIERNEAHVDLLTKYRFWIIPVFNPDGYDYSMTFPFRRGWTKNLKQSWDICKGREACYACENYGLRCTVQSCYGVNLDRNFEYQWIPAEELRAEHPCGDLYAGARQLSEAETRALTHFLHEQRTSVYAFIAFKEGDILGVMYPYSHTRKKRAFDHIYRQRASRAASAAYSISGRPYVAGQTSEFLPLYAGGIEDWVDGHLGIDNTYTIMMFRNTDSYNTRLITERVVHEAYAATDTLLLQSTEPLGPRPVALTRARNAAAKHSINSFYTINVMIILFHK